MSSIDELLCDLTITVVKAIEIYKYIDLETSCVCIENSHMMTIKEAQPRSMWYVPVVSL